MSVGVATRPTEAPSALFRPSIDLLLGCGGLYLLFTGAMALGGVDLDRSLVLRPLLLLFFSIPHYGATLSRIYGSRSERRHYAIFAYGATALVLLAFAAGLALPLAATILVTVYLTWSPWHYTGQNYGIVSMLLRRAGTPLEGVTRRLLHTAFTLSFVIVALVMHGSLGENAGYSGEAGFGALFGFHALGIPRPITAALVPLACLGLVGCLIAAAALLVRQGDVRKMGAPALLVLTQMIWFPLPFALAHFDVRTGLPYLDMDRRDHLFVFIAGAHAIQYLWVTTYFARQSSQWNGFGRYWLKTMLAGQFVWTLPIIVVAASGVTNLGYDGGLFLLLASAVNVHHFILDGAIWKLRSGPIAKVLLRGEREGPADEEAGTRWPGRVAWALAAFALVVGLWVPLQGRIFMNAVDEDLDRAAHALDRIGWTGHGRRQAHLQLAGRALEEGRNELASDQARRSLAMRPQHPRAYLILGESEAAAGRVEEALEAYEGGLVLTPESPELRTRAGLAAFELGDYARARDYLKPIVASGRGSPEAARAYVEAKKRLDGTES